MLLNLLLLDSVLQLALSGNCQLGLEVVPLLAPVLFLLEETDLCILEDPEQLVLLALQAGHPLGQILYLLIAL